MHILWHGRLLSWTTFKASYLSRRLYCLVQALFANLISLFRRSFTVTRTNSEFLAATAVAWPPLILSKEDVQDCDSNLVRRLRNGYL
jgi:hypothetical protein